MWIKVIAIATGGALGALARYGISSSLQQRFPKFAPVGTLAANLLGCLLIGILLAMFAENKELSPAWRLFLVTGILGSLTTFSTFGAETMQLMEQGEARLALLNIALNLLLGLACVWLGTAIAKAL